MFKKTAVERQLSLFSGAEDFMGKRASKKYLDPKAWHNQFFKMVTSRIDEEIFRVLFSEGKKHGRPVASYSCGVSESGRYRTCGSPSLITSVQTGTATHSDCSFLSGAVEASRCVTGQDVEEVFADGAYQSPDNLEFAQGEGITLKTGKMQGGCRYILNLKEAADELMVTDTTTGEAQKAIYMGHAPKPDKTGRKWRRWKIPFRHKDGVQSWRYFPEDEIRRSELRQKILAEDPKELAKRNNVEAAMFL